MPAKGKRRGGIGIVGYLPEVDLSNEMLDRNNGADKKSMCNKGDLTLPIARLLSKLWMVEYIYSPVYANRAIIVIDSCRVYKLSNSRKLLNSC
jgi:hypothetical protein